MFLFIGLGNPTKEHERNRHNIGFMAVDEIARLYNFPPYKSKYQGEYSEGIIDGEKIAILKPHTFMNLSGRSVAPCINFYKIPLNQVFVFHDELDVAEGRVRIKIGGGAGGHNGIKSLDESLGNSSYYRIRMGIGHPGHKDRVHGYVLGNFSSEEQVWVDDLCRLAAKYAPMLLQNRLNEFMQNVKIVFKEESKNDGI
jgi:PTH1 family peptidyl-tRNA hydrolase